MAETIEREDILEAIKDLEKKVDDIKTALSGSATDTDKVGLIERVRRLENWVENEKRFAWLFGGAIGMDVIMRIWALITKTAGG